MKKEKEKKKNHPPIYVCSGQNTNSWGLNGDLKKKSRTLVMTDTGNRSSRNRKRKTRRHKRTAT